MKLDSTAAAYGLIQVVFADVTERLATAVFVLKQERDTSVTFEQIYKSKFKQLLESFRDELKQFDGQEAFADDLHLIREACRELGSLSAWRNDRIHARVRQVDDGLALYGSKTGKRLSTSYKECDEILQNLIRVIFRLETYLPVLIRSLALKRELDDFFKEHWKEIEEG